MNNEKTNETEKRAGIAKGKLSKTMTVMLALILALVLTFTSCGSSTEETGDAGTYITTTSAEYTAASKSEMFTERDLSGDYDESGAVSVTLNG